MPPKVVVDASIWVSFFLGSDANYAPSSHWIKSFIDSKGTFVEPSFLQIELAAATTRATGNPFTSMLALGQLAHTSNIVFMPMDELFIEAAIEIATHLRLRAGDAIYAALAYQQGVPLVSWDKEQLDRASRIISTFTPETYPF